MSKLDEIEKRCAAATEDTDYGLGVKDAARLWSLRYGASEYARTDIPWIVSMLRESIEPMSDLATQDCESWGCYSDETCHNEECAPALARAFLAKLNDDA